MNIELQLLATMLKTGDFSPLIDGRIVKEHFETDAGTVLYNFITTYRSETDGAATYPSLSVVKARWKSSGMELPDPDPGDTVEALTHETRLARFRSELRQLAVNASQIADTSSDPFGETIPLIAALRKAAEATQRAEHVSFASGLGRVLENYEKKEILPNGIPFPWPSLTEATRGLHRKECIAIVGRPKSRKTFTALRIGTHAYKHHGARVLVFSPEMPVRQMFLRSVAHLCDLPYAEFKGGALQQEAEARFFEAVQTYARIENMEDLLYHMKLQELCPELADDAQTPSFDIVQSTGRDSSWMASQIEIYRPDLVIVDSYYRHRGVGQKKNDSDWRAMTAISREIKDLAMHHNVAMIVTSQLNREAQRSVGDLNSIAFSDAIAADMDAIYRVITGKVEGQDVSALVNYAQRDVAFDGVMIRNSPCYDYSELGKITNRKTVEQLLKQEEASASKDEAERLAAQVRAGGQGTPNQPSPLVTRADGAIKRKRPFKGNDPGAFHAEMKKKMEAANQGLDP